MKHSKTIGAFLLAAGLAGCQPTETGGSFEDNIADATRDTVIQVDLLDQGREVGRLCIENMPDVIAARRALRDAGYGVKFADGEFAALGRDVTDLMAFVNNRRSESPGCGFVIRNMSLGEGGLVGADMAQLISGERFNLDDAEAPVAWVGQRDGLELGIVLRREFNIPGLIRGAAIVVVQP